MPIWATPLITQLAPVLFAMLAPIVTALLEALGEKLGIPIPKPALPVVAHASGIGLAAVASGGLLTSGMVVPLGMVGAQLGNRVREAITKNKKATAPST